MPPILADVTQTGRPTPLGTAMPSRCCCCFSLQRRQAVASVMPTTSPSNQMPTVELALDSLEKLLGVYSILANPADKHSDA